MAKLLPKHQRGMSPEQIEEDNYWTEYAKQGGQSMTHNEEVACNIKDYGSTATAIIQSKRRLKIAWFKYQNNGTLTRGEHTAIHATMGEDPAPSWYY